MYWEPVLLEFVCVASYRCAFLFIWIHMASWGKVYNVMKISKEKEMDWGRFKQVEGFLNAKKNEKYLNSL